MTDDITGSINEIRKRFTGDEVGGSVRFGRTNQAPNGGGAITTVRVTLDDGREAWGRYSDPKNVKLRIRVRQTKARPQRYLL